MAKQKSIETVELLKEKFTLAKAVYLSDFKGMTVEQMTEFRKKMREAGMEYRVIKNTLAKIALKETDNEDISEYFQGPVAVAFSYADPVIPAKVIKESFDDIGLPIIKGGLLEGKKIDAQQAENIAKLPSKEVLLGQVVGTMSAPLTGFMGMGKNLISSFIRAISAIQEQKQ